MVPIFLSLSMTNSICAWLLVLLVNRWLIVYTDQELSPVTELSTILSCHDFVLTMNLNNASLLQVWSLRSKQSTLHQLYFRLGMCSYRKYLESHNQYSPTHQWRVNYNFTQNDIFESDKYLQYIPTVSENMSEVVLDTCFISILLENHKQYLWYLW